MVISVGLVEALGVDEAQVVLLYGHGVRRWGAVRGHQSVITVTHSHIRLNRGELLSGLSLHTRQQQGYTDIPSQRDKDRLKFYESLKFKLYLENYAF